jgi:hypothetical protein
MKFMVYGHLKILAEWLFPAAANGRLGTYPSLVEFDLDETLQDQGCQSRYRADFAEGSKTFRYG